MKNETVLKALSMLLALFGTPLVLFFFWSFLEVLFLYEISGDLKIITSALTTVLTTIISALGLTTNDYLLKFLKR
jgi:hypothetical protein